MASILHLWNCCSKPNPIAPCHILFYVYLTQHITQSSYSVKFLAECHLSVTKSHKEWFMLQFHKLIPRLRDIKLNSQNAMYSDSPQQPEAEIKCSHKN